MKRRLHINEGGARRPAGPALYVDGSIDAAFDPERDLELSHWVPNRTPAAYKADTSTEIALKFAAAEPGYPHALIINNHMDVDGLLSTFAVLQPELALRHEETLIAAAAMGDFFAWADEPGRRLFQALTLRYRQAQRDHETLQQAYDDGHAWLRSALAGDPAELEAPGVEHLARSDAVLDSGRVRRSLMGERFVHFAIEARDEEEARAARFMPSFNAPLGPGALLLPQSRNREDRERVQLISVSGPGGVSYALHYPSYCWAETPGSWRPPGLSLSESINVYHYGHPALKAAIEELDGAETAPGAWRLIERMDPFKTSLKTKFPIVAAFTGEGAKVGLSGLSPERVAEEMAAAF